MISSIQTISLKLAYVYDNEKAFELLLRAGASYGEELYIDSVTKPEKFKFFRMLTLYDQQSNLFQCPQIYHNKFVLLSLAVLYQNFDAVDILVKEYHMSLYRPNASETLTPIKMAKTQEYVTKLKKQYPINKYP